MTSNFSMLLLRYYLILETPQPILVNLNFQKRLTPNPRQLNDFQSQPIVNQMTTRLSIIEF